MNSNFFQKDNSSSRNAIQLKLSRLFFPFIFLPSLIIFFASNDTTIFGNAARVIQSRWEQTARIAPRFYEKAILSSEKFSNSLSSHQSGRAFVAAENVYTPREGGDDRNYKNTIGHGSTIVATYAATLHKILPSPPLYPWNGVSTTICESVNADFSFQYCCRAITQPPLPSVQKPSFVRCCELSRIVGRLRGRRSNELSQFSRRTWYCYNRKWLNCIFFFLSFFLVGVI